MRADCARWTAADLTDGPDGTGGVVDEWEREVPLPAGRDAASVFAALRDRLLRYEVFPPRIMRATVCSEDGRLHDGTTIIQDIRFGPVRLRAGVRVIRAWTSAWPDGEEAGITYATLRGHPERGVETLVVRRDGSDRVRFLVRARSRPASALARLGRPVARYLQLRATQAALDAFTVVDR